MTEPVKIREVEDRTTEVRYGRFTGSYRYARSTAAAREGLAWVAEVAEFSPTGAEVLGVDIETTSLAPEDGLIRLCQVAAGNRCIVIDAFHTDLPELLGPLATSGEFEWIAHNAAFEQSWFGRHAGFTLSPMFDTRAVFIRERNRRTGQYARGSSALDAVCRDLLGFDLSKEQRLSDWTAEPLSAAQIEYGALDALVLPPLRAKLLADASDGGWDSEVAAAMEHSAGEARRFAA